MELRPHHLLDIITRYGHGHEFTPSPPAYGHAEHLVAREVLADLEVPIRFVVAADDVCKPCKHLGPDGRCDDVRAGTSLPRSKQECNDQRDRRLLEYLEIPEGTVMTERQFLEICDKRLPGVAERCAWSSQTYEDRLSGLERGLRKLGIQGCR